MLRSNIKIETTFVDGTPIEKQIANAMSVQEPIDNSSPIQFTKRSDGVLPDFDIRTDKWDVAQKAMTAVADKVRQNRISKLQDIAKGDDSVTPTTTNTENKTNI